MKPCFMASFLISWGPDSISCSFIPISTDWIHFGQISPMSWSDWIKYYHASQSKIQISKEMKSILQLCSYYYETTSHLFDITLKDFSQIQLHEHSYISFTSPDISLDFGGFAKGYALKKIRKFMQYAVQSQVVIQIRSKKPAWSLFLRKEVMWCLNKPV